MSDNKIEELNSIQPEKEEVINESNIVDNTISDSIVSESIQTASLNARTTPLQPASGDGVTYRGKTAPPELIPLPNGPMAKFKGGKKYLAKITVKEAEAIQQVRESGNRHAKCKLAALEKIFNPLDPISLNDVLNIGTQFPTGELVAKEPRKKRGRPKNRKLENRDFHILAHFFAVGATEEEAAVMFGISRDTLRAEFKRNGISINKFQEACFTRMKVALRLRQCVSALKGAPGAQIWCGKQWLGQTEKITKNVKTGTQLMSNEDIDKEIKELQYKLED